MTKLHWDETDKSMFIEARNTINEATTIKWDAIKAYGEHYSAFQALCKNETQAMHTLLTSVWPDTINRKKEMDYGSACSFVVKYDADITKWRKATNYGGYNPINVRKEFRKLCKAIADLEALASVNHVFHGNGKKTDKQLAKSIAKLTTATTSDNAFDILLNNVECVADISSDRALTPNEIDKLVSAMAKIQAVVSDNRKLKVA